MTQPKKTYTSLSSLGEFGLIQHLSKNVEINHPSTIKGIGDDAAVLKHNHPIVVTTDLLVEGIHFDLTYTPLKHLGYKSVVVNISDVYAMNAQPKQITVSIAVSGKFALEHIEELYAGIKMACDDYNIDLIGGDTSSSLTGLTICVTAIGEVGLNDVVYRDGAEVTNLICVSGNLGAAYMGLQVLEREKKVFEQTKGGQPKLDNYPYILQRQLRPSARKDIYEILKELGIRPTSMIDISDGLSSELLHICKSSDKGCKVFQEKIPIHKETTTTADEMNLIPLTAALNGGEDYELLFTIPINEYDKISTRNEISIIGHIVEKEEGTKLVLKSGVEADLLAQGWNALKE